MNKELINSLAWGGGIIAIALGATVARQYGFIEQDTVTRIVMGVIGLMVASFGNRMPKAFVSGAAERQVMRVGGWSLAVSGMIYAGLWAFAPFDVALWVGCGAVAAGTAVTVIYALALRSKAESA